jgi:hypothetical protein
MAKPVSKRKPSRRVAKLVKVVKVANVTKAAEVAKSMPAQAVTIGIPQDASQRSLVRLFCELENLFHTIHETFAAMSAPLNAAKTLKVTNKCGCAIDVYVDDGNGGYIKVLSNVAKNTTAMKDLTGVSPTIPSGSRLVYACQNLGVQRMQVGSAFTYDPTAGMTASYTATSSGTIANPCKSISGTGPTYA